MLVRVLHALPVSPDRLFITLSISVDPYLNELICVRCTEVAESMYARKNPVARARVFRDYKSQFGAVDVKFAAIEETDDGEGEYRQTCTECGVELSVNASEAK